MSISILNTDSNLTAKTVLTAENAETVTGLKTFDRDPSAPFAVTSASAVVANLDADKVDGYNASPTPTTYTPTLVNFVLNNGSMSASYSRFGLEVRFRIAITFGGTSTYGAGGAWTISLPITADTSGFCAGGGYLLDASAPLYYNTALTLASTTTIALTPHGGASVATTTVPFTWATTDQLVVSGFYFAASAL